MFDITIRYQLQQFTCILRIKQNCTIFYKQRIYGCMKLGRVRTQKYGIPEYR
jgi:hypothetical protein